MTDFHNAFTDRLLQVLAGRKKHPWGQALGISNAVITTMFRGQIPTFDALAAIQRGENISLDWLLEGHGAPYLVHREPTDSAAAAYLRRLTDEPDQRVHLLSDGVRLAVVLEQPATYTVRDRTIDYREIEIIAGACGVATAEAVAGLLGELAAPARLVDLPPAQLSAVIAGERGTYALLGDAGHPGLLAEAVEIRSPRTLREYLAARGFDERVVAEEASAYDALDETVLLAAYRRLPADDRERLRGIAEVLVEIANRRREGTNDAE